MRPTKPWPWIKFLPPELHVYFAARRGREVHFLADNRKLDGGTDQYGLVTSRYYRPAADAVFPLHVVRFWLTHPHECRNYGDRSRSSPEYWREAIEDLLVTRRA